MNSKCSVHCTYTHTPQFYFITVCSSTSFHFTLLSDWLWCLHCVDNTEKKTLICIFIKTRQTFNAFQFELFCVNMPIFSAQRANEPCKKVEMRRGTRNTNRSFVDELFHKKNIILKIFFFPSLIAYVIPSTS